MSSSLRYLLPWHWLPLRLLRRKKASETDYEVILESLARDVSKVQSRLTQIRQRERRAIITIPFYIIVVWAIYAWLCWYMAWLGPLSELPSTLLSRREVDWRRTGTWIPLLSTPVVLLFGRRIVRWWYERIANAEEKHLRKLRREQRSKIEEIKKATRYDHLRMLLSKYDDTQGATSASAARRAPNGGAVRPSPQQAQQSQLGVQSGRNPNRSSAPEKAQLAGQAERSGAEQPAGADAKAKAGEGNTAANGARDQVRIRTSSEGDTLSAPRSQDPFGPPQPAPQPRTLLDKVADLVLGADPNLKGPGPEQRYALICPDCKRHNGLCPKEDWEEIQYICPNCGRFNSNRPSTVPTSWPSAMGPRSRVDSNASISSFLFSAFGSGQQQADGAAATRAAHRASGSHLQQTKPSTAHEGSISLPTTPAKKGMILDEDSGSMLRSDSRGASLSVMDSTSLRRAGSRRSELNETPEEDAQEVLMTPELAHSESQDNELRRAYGANALRRRTRNPSGGNGKDDRAVQDGQDDANGDDSVVVPPSASLLDDADDSMEIHRR